MEAKEQSVREQVVECSPLVLVTSLLLLLFRMLLRASDSPAPFGKAVETSVSQTDEV